MSEPEAAKWTDILRPMKLLAGPLGMVVYLAACVPWLTVIVLGITGWPFYAAASVWFIVGLPISVNRRRARKAASERPSVAN